MRKRERGGEGERGARRQQDKDKVDGEGEEKGEWKLDQNGGMKLQKTIDKIRETRK